MQGTENTCNVVTMHIYSHTQNIDYTLFNYITCPVSQEDTHKVVMRPSRATAERSVTIAVSQQATPSYNLSICYKLLIRCSYI